MRIYQDWRNLKGVFHRPALTIGNFDGVHLGHRALFDKVVQLARAGGGEAVAMTFEPHPLRVLRPDSPPKLISTLEQKIELIERAGMDALVCLRFTRELAATTADRFVDLVLVEHLGIRDLVIGYDYALGRGREGDRDFLRRKGEALGFAVHVVPPVVVDGMTVSSTLVRRLVAEGEMRKVRRLLGRYYQIRGTVQRGRQRGGPEVGFPTANLTISEEDLCPKKGVYVVQVLHETACYGGVLNIGFNPTFGDGRLSAEVHIFDFDRDIYGHPIKVNLIQRLRDERRFPGPEALAAQIRQDIEAARRVLEQEKGLRQACLEG
ncbi:bifunctional riboflavin kinase/FAD synthetase [Dissulfurirhabdus thermomarina]|uniref:Riboflavin biosynthesis protein n=1 Tax=Dissulfurirhabdus thermomarina TaxID=1765737 RepID=A0A6N9TRF0_DISTH|nr:bifunctional riboflavin kinase/FAD synthetase [Dissulfurirhabdus thermomarina]NDY42017.1 bifunctional riboflavin kinase/FAD synthetase [Dissulfurirhabdus thermomarina]NMX23998.1 bifunctional riboflavin kinase/FAD synthetase [Dissulfurirhabdus thermomarina]